jgi:hypothetical protein
VQSLTPSCWTTQTDNTYTHAYIHTSDNSEEGCLDGPEIDGADFLAHLATKNDMGNCYRIVCSSPFDGAIGHFAGPCDAIEAEDDFDTHCEAHHACPLFDNSDAGTGAALTSAVTALAATAVAFASLL